MRITAVPEVPAPFQSLMLTALLCATTAAAWGAPESAPAVSAPDKSAAAVLEAPIALSDPGGQGLDLERLDVRLAAHGPLALTELEMVFRNPADRVMEGRFVATLPTGATLSRFAKEVNGSLVEGEVVERLRASQVYTEMLHTMRDPALLEQDQGNRFRAKIFPIPAKGQVRLILGYSSLHPIAADGRRHITVPLRGLPKIGKLKVLAVCRPLPGEKVELTSLVGAPRELTRPDAVTFAEEVEQSDFTPTQDLGLAFMVATAAPRVQCLRAGQFQMTVFSPAAASGGGVATANDWHLWVDTSASQADQQAPRLQALEALLSEIESRAKGAAVQVEAFDLESAPMGAFTAGDGGAKKAITAIRDRHFLGATDLESMLKRLGDQARAHQGPRSYVLVTDAIPSLGSREAGDLVRALGTWPERSTLHVVSIGSRTDATIARALTRAGGGRVVELPLDTGLASHAAKAAEALVRPRGLDYQAYDEDAEWVQPRTFQDVAPGEELIVFSRLRAAGKSQVGLARKGMADLRPGSDPVLEVTEFAPLLEREAYRAYLDTLVQKESEATDPAQRARLKGEQVKVSVEHRVLCPLTSLLVLESEDDYQRFGLERRALVSVMTVGPKGIAMLDRATDAAVSPAPVGETAEVAAEEGRSRIASKLSENKGPSAPQPQKADHDSSGRGRSAPGGESRDELATSEDAVQSNGMGAPAEVGGGQSGPEGAITRGTAFSGSSTPDAESSNSLEAASPDDAPPAAPAAAPPALEFRSEGRSDRRGTSMAGAAGAPMRERSAQSVPRPSQALRPALESLATEPPSPGSAPGRVVSPAIESSELERSRDRADNRRQVVTNPPWVGQATWKPQPTEVDQYRKAVAAAPLDRLARNRLCYALLRDKAFDDLRTLTLDWQPFDPENPMVYEFLSEALTRSGQRPEALRAASSIADVAGGDSGLLNRSGYLLLRAGQPVQAEKLFRAAIVRRPDHANNYRGLALALWQQERHEDAVKALQEALAQNYHGRYGNVQRILHEELQMILGAWTRSKPEDGPRIKALAEKLNLAPDHSDDLRVTLHWETDANDVDLHVVDPRGEECFYSHKRNRSGLELYEDLTQGLGPETARVPTGRLAKGAYHVGVTYFSSGPMGVSRGVVVVHRPSTTGLPDVQIETFCLLPDLGGAGQDLRHVAVVEGAVK